MKSAPSPKATPPQSLKHTRRDFLTTTSLLAGSILAFGFPFFPGRADSAFAAQSRKDRQREGVVSYVLELDGALVGPLHSLEGGVVSGEIISYQDGNDLILRKRLGRLKYEDIVLTCGANLSQPFYQWIVRTLSGENTRKNGAIVAINENGQITDRREFQNALIKEVQFPALDAASREPAYFTVTMSPEQIRYRSISGQTSPSPQAPHAGLHASNFRLQIQGLEQACAFVKHIDSLVISQEIINYRDGRSAETSRIRGGRLQIGNLVIRLPQHQAEPFSAWFSEFVLQGQAVGNRKQGTLEFLSSDGHSVLVTVALSNLGIFRMAPINVGRSSQVQVEMFCETMQLTQFPGGGAATGHSQPAAHSTAPKVLTPGKKPRLPRRRKNFRLVVYKSRDTET